MSDQLSYFERMKLIKLGLLPKEAVPKTKKPIAKISDKKKKELKEAKDKETGETELVKWFKGRMKYMGYSCKECGILVETNDYKHAIHHIAHILPKRDTMCPSVALHPLNFVTLCQHHHDLFDSYSYDDKGWAEREKWACWPLVRERLIMLYSDLAPDERRHFPESVRKYIEENEPF